MQVNWSGVPAQSGLSLPQLDRIARSALRPVLHRPPFAVLVLGAGELERRSRAVGSVAHAARPDRAFRASSRAGPAAVCGARVPPGDVGRRVRESRRGRRAVALARAAQRATAAAVHADARARPDRRAPVAPKLPGVSSWGRRPRDVPGGKTTTGRDCALCSTRGLLECTRIGHAVGNGECGCAARRRYETAVITYTITGVPDERWAEGRLRGSQWDRRNDAVIYGVSAAARTRSHGTETYTISFTSRQRASADET